MDCAGAQTPPALQLEQCKHRWKGGIGLYPGYLPLGPLYAQLLCLELLFLALLALSALLFLQGAGQVFTALPLPVTGRSDCVHLLDWLSCPGAMHWREW